MPTNERLRGSLATAQLRPVDVAERTGVDPKTVERWVTQGRLPHRTHRVAVGKMLGVDQNRNLTWVGGTVGIWPVD